jgi:hypothetical protein
MSLNLILYEKPPKMFNYLKKEMEELFQKEEKECSLS